MLARGGFEFRGVRAPAASATEAKGEGGNSQAFSANRRFQKQLLPKGSLKKKAQIFKSIWLSGKIIKSM